MNTIIFIAGTPIVLCVAYIAASFLAYHFVLNGSAKKTEKANKHNRGAL